MTENEQLALTMPPPATWTTPPGKHTCGRDPAAGPGSCHHWWDGCPKADKRGCYILYVRKMREAAQS